MLCWILGPFVLAFIMMLVALVFAITGFIGNKLFPQWMHPTGFSKNPDFMELCLLGFIYLSMAVIVVSITFILANVGHAIACSIIH